MGFTSLKGRGFICEFLKTAREFLGWTAFLSRLVCYWQTHILTFFPQILTYIFQVQNLDYDFFKFKIWTMAGSLLINLPPENEWKFWRRMIAHCLKDVNQINELKAQFCIPSPFVLEDITPEKKTSHHPERLKWILLLVCTRSCCLGGAQLACVIAVYLSCI